MNIKQQINILKNLLEGVKHLNKEYYDGGYMDIEEGEALLKHLKMIDKDRWIGIKEQIAPLKWAHHPNPLMKIDSWSSKSTMGLLSIDFNNECYTLKVINSGILGKFQTFEETKNEAQERHDNIIIQFFTP